MKWNTERGCTETVDFPIEETWAVLEAAEKAADLETLQWCVRRLLWLYETSDTSEGGEGPKEVRLFNRAWAATLKDDPPPESVKDIIDRIGQDEAEAAHVV